MHRRTQPVLIAKSPTEQEAQLSMATMRTAGVVALALMACGLLLLSTTCQAGGAASNPLVRTLQA
jgi:hypothetical protein